uniref:SapB_1 domain-containing protein n=1 Tax=Angiostrongylus cantonensis TaxID=6313 RepID=A0A158P7G1_ANGCA
MPIVALPIVLLLVTPSSADEDLMETFKNIDVFRLRASANACPLLVVGEVCPQENPLYYFKCCGDLNASCCFRLQKMKAGFGVAVIIGILSVISAEVTEKPLCSLCEDIVKKVDDLLEEGEAVEKDHASPKEVCTNLGLCAV